MINGKIYILVWSIPLIAENHAINLDFFFLSLPRANMHINILP